VSGADKGTNQSRQNLARTHGEGQGRARSREPIGERRDATALPGGKRIATEREREREVKGFGPYKGLRGSGESISGHTEVWVDVMWRKRMEMYGKKLREVT
jgi:hypothetical protein